MTWQPSERVPDAAVREVDASFARYRLALCKVERLAGAPLSPPMRWAEGPVWMGDARCLLWSDVPGNCIWRHGDLDVVSYFKTTLGSQSDSAGM